MAKQEVKSWGDPEIAKQWMTHVNGENGKDGKDQRNGILIPRLLAHIGEPHGQMIADIGSGSGGYLHALPKDNTIISTDINFNLLEAQKDERAIRIQSDITGGIPLKSDFVDVGISNLVLMWIKNLPKAAQEMSRIVKPDGKLIITITHPTYALGVMQKDSDGLFMKLPVQKEEIPVLKGINKNAVGPFFTYTRLPETYIHAFGQYGLCIDHTAPMYGLEEIRFPKEFTHSTGDQEEYKLKQVFPTWLLLHFKKRQEL
ncbi:class I SAM-dependent methyltransferase [Patescibacteria group bacterium]|nr:class I SAM-dependent methyltransferase [Patescibacteria group bacterium]